MGIRKDCFAWNGSACTALNGCNIKHEPYCKYESQGDSIKTCKFYMCREEYEAKLKETEEKLKKG